MVKRHCGASNPRSHTSKLSSFFDVVCDILLFPVSNRLNLMSVLNWCVNESNRSPHAVFFSNRKRASPLPKDDHSSGVKDCLLANSSDPVEMRRLNYQTPGNTLCVNTHRHRLARTHTMCSIRAYFHMRNAETHSLCQSSGTTSSVSRWVRLILFSL